MEMILAILGHVMQEAKTLALQRITSVTKEFAKPMAFTEDDEKDIN
jgi:hypothetical protein